MSRRKIPQNYHELAKERGYEWLGPFPSNTHTKTFWRCPEGHEWEAYYHNIQRGTGCPVCVRVEVGERRRIKSPDYYKLAEERGFEWLGSEVSGSQTKTRWKCSEGHEWDACYSHIRRGYGCPYCSGTARKTPGDYYKLAKNRNFEWLGPEVPNSRTKTWWKCSHGHEWETIYATIKNGASCPYCTGSFRKIPRDYCKLAGEMNFEWLGSEAVNTRTKTWWKCPEGHKWEAPYNSLQGGHGCPRCARIKSGEKRKRKPFDYHELAKSKSLKWKGKEPPKDSHTRTLWQCSETHQWETSYSGIKQGNGCPHCYGNARKIPQDYHDLAKSRKFEWLGPFPQRVVYKTRWECLRSHEWEACYHDIQKGHGCPHCLDIVNGYRVSILQREIYKMIGGELNRPFGKKNRQGRRKTIDVALSNKMIAVEYDCWFWHGSKQDYDAQRDKLLLAAGWKVLHIRSNNLLPSQVQLDEAIARLENGETMVEIILPDWGKGNTFADVRAREKVDPWTLGPVPISFDGGMTVSECQQLLLWA